MFSSRTTRCVRAVQTARAVLRPHSLRPFLPIVQAHQQRFYAEKVKVPQMAESISEGTLSQFTKKVGDFVKSDELLATIDTDKIAVEVNAPMSGVIKELLVNEDDTVTVGQDLLIIEPGEAPSGGKSSDGNDASSGGATSAKKDVTPKDHGAPKSDTPAKKQSNDSNASDSSQSSGKPPAPAPQIQAQTSKSEPKPPKSSDASKSASQKSEPSMPGSREERKVKMNRMRLRISERLKESQNTAASLTTFNEIDMSAIMEFRKKYKDEVLKSTGVKLGFMSAFTLACVRAMREFPVVNACISGPNGGDTIVYHDYVDVSVAVATEKGLVTPVIRNVESMDMIGIENAIAEIGKKARDGKLTIEDMAGGTFTISNGGIFGSLMGTPIINLPQSAVLGLHGIKDRVVAVNGKPEVRPMMYVALTYDHRLLDGREAVLFLVRVKEMMEDPRRMLL